MSIELADDGKGQPSLDDRVPKDKRIAIVQHAVDELMLLAAKLGCVVQIKTHAVGLFKGTAHASVLTRDDAVAKETARRMALNVAFGKMGMRRDGYFGGVAQYGMTPSEIKPDTNRPNDRYLNECPANGTSCSFSANGPAGETQCDHCGQVPESHPARWGNY